MSTDPVEPVYSAVMLPATSLPILWHLEQPALVERTFCGFTTERTRGRAVVAESQVCPVCVKERAAAIEAGLVPLD